MAQKKKRPSSSDGAETGIIRGFFKNPLKSLGIVLVVILIVFAFVLPGAGSFSCDRGREVAFGYYDKAPINYLPVAQRFKDIEEYYRQNNFDSSMMGYQEWLWAFEYVLRNTAILQELKQAGYVAPDSIVDRSVAKYFIENGRFSITQYNNLSEGSRQLIWNQTQEDITREKYRQDVFGLAIPDGEKEFIENMASATRNFKMAVFPVDDYPDSEIEAFANENPGLFRSVYLSVISAESGEQEAKEILKSIQSGEYSLEDAARGKSSDDYSERGGDMGVMMAHELRYIIPEESDREKIINLEKDSYSDIVNTVSGSSFFYAQDDAEEADFSDPATLEKVRSYVREVEGGRMENWAIDRANEFISQVNDVGFDNALAQTGVESRSFGPLPLNYGDVSLFTTLSSQSVDILYQAESNEYFWKAAFSADINSPSQPVVHRGNVLVLFPVSETQSDESSDIDEVNTSSFNSDWLINNAEQSLTQFFLTSPKMDNKFYDIYSQYLMPRDE